jgi:hypothetical protein
MFARIGEGIPGLDRGGQLDRPTHSASGSMHTMRLALRSATSNTLPLGDEARLHVHLRDAAEVHRAARDVGPAVAGAVVNLLAATAVAA